MADREPPDEMLGNLLAVDRAANRYVDRIGRAVDQIIAGRFLAAGVAKGCLKRGGSGRRSGIDGRAGGKYRSHDVDPSVKRVGLTRP